MNKDEAKKTDQFEAFISAMDEGLTRYAIIRQSAPLIMASLISTKGGGLTTQDMASMARHCVTGANYLADEILKFDPARKLGGSDDDSSAD